MSRIGLLPLLMVTAFSVTTSHAQVFGRIALDGSIVVTGESELIGLDIQSSGGYLEPVGSADPFEALLKNTSSHIAYASLSSTVELDGDLILSAKWSAPGDVSVEDDLEGLWGGLGEGNDGDIVWIPEASGYHLSMMSLVGIGFLRKRARRAT